MDLTLQLSRNGMDFIDDTKLHGLLSKPSDPAQVREIVAKSLEKKALTVEETAVLVNTNEPELLETMFEAARELKRKVYGNRIVLFAPLYIGNSCINDCKYCGFRNTNQDAVRRTLTSREVTAQVEALEAVGHKRLILVFGEHPKYSPEFIAETTRLVYATKNSHGAIRRVNINAAPLDIDGFRTVKDAGIGTYQVFQETYHKETYADYHPKGTRKGDFLWRLDALSRAQEGGVDDVGLGALFGLYDWRFEVLGLITHSLFLQERYGVGPHTLSFPRMQPASGIEYDQKWMVQDSDFMKLVAILRLAVPYTGLIMTCREKPAIRKTVLGFGVSQIDAGSRIEIGGYTEAGDGQQQVQEKEQFELGDIRSLDEVARELMTDGYIPSFCTACYRVGRTGEVFMEYAVPGFIERYCTPNALTTLQEYLADYASLETRVVGEKLIDGQLALMPESAAKRKLIERLEKIRGTEERDLYV